MRAIAVDPANPYERWVASGSGIWFTWVFGHGWTNESLGLTNPDGASALAFYRNTLYASDLTGVYSWDGASASWKRAFDKAGVISLTSNRDLLVANSYTSGLAVYDGRSWLEAGSGLAVHAHGGGRSAHVISVATPAAGGLIVVQPGRVGFSSDAGGSWTELGSGLPDGTWDATRYGNRVYAATSGGLYSYALETAPQDSPGWWLVMLAAALVAGVIAIGVAARSGRIFPGRGKRAA